MKPLWRPFGPGWRIASAQEFFARLREQMGSEIDRRALYDFLVRNGPPDADNVGRVLGVVAVADADERVAERSLTAGMRLIGADSDARLERQWRELDMGGATTRDWLAQDGWHVEKLGPTGRAKGRPPQLGVPSAAVELRIQNQRPAYALAEMLASLGKRRRTPVEVLRHNELARTVAGAMASPMRKPPAVSVAAMATFLGCTPNTVYRLRTKGQEMQKKSPKGGEAELRPSTYWAFASWTAVRDPDNPFVTLYAPPRRRESVVTPLEPASAESELEEAA